MHDMNVTKGHAVQVSHLIIPGRQNDLLFVLCCWCDAPWCARRRDDITRAAESGRRSCGRGLVLRLLRSRFTGTSACHSWFLPLLTRLLRRCWLLLSLALLRTFAINFLFLFGLLRGICFGSTFAFGFWFRIIRLYFLIVFQPFLLIFRWLETGWLRNLLPGFLFFGVTFGVATKLLGTSFVSRLFFSSKKELHNARFILAASILLTVLVFRSWDTIQNVIRKRCWNLNRTCLCEFSQVSDSHAF